MNRDINYLNNMRKSSSQTPTPGKMRYGMPKQGSEKRLL